MAEIELGIQGLSDFDEIGSGGFSTVYSALEAGTNRKVAVKVLAAIDGAGRRRFDREQLTMGRTTSHTNIVTLLRAGYTDPGDKPFLVLEYLGGGSLQDHIDADRYSSWDQAVDLVLPIADALGYSHGNDIIHKDVKPANILLSNTGVVKLTDFGIAAIKEATATSQVAYSLHYAPPESFDIWHDTNTGLFTDPRDERSDLYSLAATLYALGTGTPPFTGPTARVLMAQILHHPVPATGNATLDRFLATAMAKDPGDRYPDASAFIDALSQSLKPSAPTVAGARLFMPRATELVDGPVTNPIEPPWPGPVPPRPASDTTLSYATEPTDSDDDETPVDVEKAERGRWLVASLGTAAVIATAILTLLASDGAPDAADLSELVLGDAIVAQPPSDTGEPPVPTTAGSQFASPTTWPGPGGGQSVILAADGSEIARYQPLFDEDPVGGGSAARWSDVEFSLTGQDPATAGFIVEVLKELEDLPSNGTDERGLALQAGGLRIRTSFDGEAQAAAFDAIAEEGGLPSEDFEAVLVTVDNRTGAVQAIVGPNDDQVGSVALSGWLEPGSAIRPLVLASAFESGWVPTDQVRSNAPCLFDNEGFTPNPYTMQVGDTEEDQIRPLSEALDLSQQCAIARIGDEVGLDVLIEQAEQLGLERLDESPGFAHLWSLGVHDIRPVSLASAYATLANDGLHLNPWTVERIDFTDGSVYYERGNESGEQTIDEETARLTIEAMTGEAKRGGQPWADLIDGHEIAAQPGPTLGGALWFVGATRHFATAVWIGDPDASGIDTELSQALQDDATAANIWLRYNERVHADLAPESFTRPGGYSGGRLMGS